VGPPAHLPGHPPIVDGAPRQPRGFLDHGKVVEVGAPDELLARAGGAYRALIEAERREAGALP
jgi:hypothetical protein